MIEYQTYAIEIRVADRDERGDRMDWPSYDKDLTGAFLDSLDRFNEALMSLCAGYARRWENEYPEGKVTIEVTRD